MAKPKTVLKKELFVLHFSQNEWSEGEGNKKPVMPFMTWPQKYHTGISVTRSGSQVTRCSPHSRTEEFSSTLLSGESKELVDIL